MLGGAVGDALGAPLEFLTDGEIVERFGAGGLREYAPAYGRTGAITDDTQMSLFTAEGLLSFWVGERVEGRASLEACASIAYLRWLGTQVEGIETPCLAGTPPTRSWLLEFDAVRKPRAPGMTCVAALALMTHLGAPACNDSKGCGGVMRSAPVGLFAHLHGGPGWAFDAGCRLAGLTHGHPTGQHAAGVLAALVAGLVAGRTLEQGLDDATRELRSRPRHDETLGAVARARELAASRVEPAAAIRALGQGWVAEEALAIALYCALASGDFETGVRLAVHHGGDSDSTGAIAGNLLGARLGVRAIPERWLGPLELRDVIEELADDLATCRAWPLSGAETPADARTPETLHYLRKYPPCRP